MLKQVLAVLVLVSIIEGASIEKAKMLNTHGLKDAAKQELIDVIFGTSGTEAKADAYYYLGNIALTERKITAAISTWRELVEKYPNSKRIVEVQQRIEVLRVGLSDTLDTALGNMEAQLYLQNAEFLGMHYVSKNFVIETARLPDEAGFKWLDKVIAKFPGTAEAEKAYKYKFFQLYKEVMPLSYEHIFTNKMNKLISLFEEFEAAFPKSTSLQMFRFQIAQLYITHEMEVKAAAPWLNKIIEAEGDRDSLYKQIAQYRLKMRK